MSQKPSIHNPHLRPSPEFVSEYKTYWGAGWYGHSNKGLIECYGTEYSKPPVANANAQWFQTRDEAEQSLVRTNITTEGGKRKRGYSRRRRGDKRKSRRGSKKRKLKMRG